MPTLRNSILTDAANARSQLVSNPGLTVNPKLLMRRIWRLISWVALLLIYSIVILPLGLIYKLIGRDPLRRMPDPKATTYWNKRAKN